MDVLTSGQSAIDCAQVISNICSTVAASRFLYTTQSTDMSKKRKYPSIKCFKLMEKITEMFPEFDKTSL
jgi:orotate phosphoribosyltransferase